MARCTYGTTSAFIGDRRKVDRRRANVLNNLLIVASHDLTLFVMPPDPIRESYMSLPPTGLRLVSVDLQL